MRNPGAGARDAPARLRLPPAFWVRCIEAACLLGATWNHAAILVRYGLLNDYGGRPAALCAYWTALTFADPAAAILLFLRPRVGLLATCAIITSDVAVNSAVALDDRARYGPQPISAYLMLIEQSLFLVFVLAALRPALRRVRDAAARPGCA